MFLNCGLSLCDLRVKNPVEDVLRALTVFGDQVEAECGLRLNRGKTEFYAATAALSEDVAEAMREAELKEGRDEEGRRGIVVVGIPIGVEEYVSHFVRRKVEEASSKSTSIITKLVPFELQAAQVLAYYCLTPLVDYLAASLPPDDVRAELSKFDDNLLACVVPAVLPAAIAEDDLLLRRLRMPGRLNGGAIRARGDWLAATAYAATMIRILPAMVNHVPRRSNGGMEVQGFLHIIFAPLLGDGKDDGGRYAQLEASNSGLAYTFRHAYMAMQQAAGIPPSGPLAHPFARAGEGLKTAEEMARYGDDPDGQPPTKLLEQKQYTEVIEDFVVKGLRADFSALDPDDMRKVAFFSVNQSSRHFLYTPPLPGCELDADEFGVVAARYFGTVCPVCAPKQGMKIRARGSGANNQVLDAYGKAIVNSNLGGGLWTVRHNAVLMALAAELAHVNNAYCTDVYGLFEGRFGDGSAAASAAFASYIEKDVRRRQGLVPDIRIKPHEVVKYRVVAEDTLFELKQINLVPQYFQVHGWENQSNAVKLRAGRVDYDYHKKLHDADRAAGTQCPAPLSAAGHCSRGGAHLHTRHTVGGAEEHLNNKWGPVVPLVFGHFGEFNEELLEFIGKISESIAAQHHRKLGFKNELGGRSRAKAGIMQRISMVALRATARQVIRGVALVGAANVQAHSDRRAEKTAEAAKYDAFGPNHGGAFRPFDCGRTA